MSFLLWIWPPCKYCGKRRLSGLGLPGLGASRVPEHAMCHTTHGYLPHKEH